MPILHTGEAGMDVIAGKLGVSRQTLFRRLKAEGVTFEKVLDELRHKLALHYLSGKKVSVNETAYLVGFSDPAAFSRVQALDRLLPARSADFKGRQRSDGLLSPADHTIDSAPNIAASDMLRGYFERQLLTFPDVFVAARLINIDEARSVINFDNKVAEKFLAEDAVNLPPRAPRRGPGGRNLPAEFIYNEFVDAILHLVQRDSQEPLI
jgi:Helix-turn-helix domain